MKEYKRMQSGGMLLEMIAVLGLVAVSAPAIYKKNIERTEEIRDMTKASQLRVLKDAASQYVEKQYESLIRDAYKGDGGWQDSGSDNSVHKVVKQIPAQDLENYLPEGFQIDDGVQVYLTAKRDKTEEGEKNRPRGLVSAIVIDNEDVTETRGNRIARMVGVEGGYTMDGNAYGNRGAWSLSSADLGGAAIPENRVTVTSTYSKNLSSADYIYRNKVEGYPEANMMYTDIDMNGNSIDHIGRLAMRYNNGDKWADPHIYNPDDPDDKPEFEGSTGNSADATRDQGLSLLVHGERGEIVGKTRTAAKNKKYQWWNKDRVDGEISTDAAAATITDTSHFDSDDSDNEKKATLELSVGGPAKSANERDGYLRLRANDSNACTRIESNYRMPDRNLTLSGLTGGGAFIACTNDPRNADTAMTKDAPGADSNGGKLGMPTASLVADDLSVGANDAAVASKAGGSGYMIVTNPNNNRKAIMYGNYATSFFNADGDNDIRKDYSGAAMEAINAGDKIVALSAASLSGGKKGAKNGVTHTEEGTVTNLYDQNGNIKTQFRADERGGFIYAYGDNSQDYADIPTVAVKGSQDIDGVEPNESYALVTRRQNKGYAIMQSNYKEYDGDVATGAFMIKDEKTKKEVAVMGNKKAGNDGIPGGYFALKDGDSQDRFRALGTENGGAVYMGNSSNNSRLDKPEDASNVNRTVMIETYHNGASNPAGGYMKLSNTRGSTLEVASNNAEADDEQGGGMFASKDGGVLTAKIHSSTVGKLGDDGIGADAGGGVALRDGDGNARKAELVTSSNVDVDSGTQGGTFALKNSGSRNVLVTARGPHNGGWMELSTDSAKGVDFYAELTGNTGGQIDLSNGGAPVISMISGKFGKTNPLMMVGGESGTNVYGSMTNGGVGTGGGFTIGGSGSVFTANEGSGSGALLLGGNGIHGTDGRVDAGGVAINASSGTLANVKDLKASARVKAHGGLSISNGDLTALVVDANSYNKFGGGNIKSMFKAAITGGSLAGTNVGAYATAAKDLGHDICDFDHKECPIFETDANGNKVEASPGEPQHGGYKLVSPYYYGPDDSKTWGVLSGTTLSGLGGRDAGVRLGRLHDYSLYSYGEYTYGARFSHEEDARHNKMYNVWKKPRYHKNERNDLQDWEEGRHNKGEKWHDNIYLRDEGDWTVGSDDAGVHPAYEAGWGGGIPSSVTDLYKNKVGPDAVPPIWNLNDLDK